MKRAAVIYHFFPHYREGIIRELNASDTWRYEWVGADVPEFQGIRASDAWKQGPHVVAPFRTWGNLLWQRGVVGHALSSQCDAFVYLANPYYLSTWVATIVCKLRGKRVLFWTHGWIAEDGFAKRQLRDNFLRLADALLLYGHRAKTIGQTRGFPPASLYVIYNSLDYDRQRVVRDAVAARSVTDVRAEQLSGTTLSLAAPLVVCTARLTKACRFDLLIDALAELKVKRRLRVDAILVGDGPERNSLESRAKEKGVEVLFRGACYDEAVLGQLLYSADLTISPGKVGLTAIHSLMYGTPVITHDRFDRQFPEVEAISQGVTGAFFAYGDSRSLASAIEDWLSTRPTKTSATAQACFRVVDERYNPHVQREIIEKALDGVQLDAESLGR